MRKTALAIPLGTLVLAGCATLPSPSDPGLAREQVFATERAFAATMAHRDARAFAGFLSQDAVFLSGKTAARGPAEITKRWHKLFVAPEAPFSWRPEQVEVLYSQSLAISSGPVFDGGGHQVATFSSIWRQEAPGVWRIVFDSGCDACNCDPH